VKVNKRILRTVKKFLNVDSPNEVAAEKTENETPAVAVTIETVVAALRTVFDPEIPVNIYDLGLIYNVNIDESNVVKIDMTLTAPGCPVAATFPGTVETAVKEVAGVVDATVALVWDPPWTMDNMSDAAKLQLGMLG
jgi:FeS assembly SUF system protein